MRKHMILLSLFVFTSLVFSIGCQRNVDTAVPYETLEENGEEAKMSEVAWELGITAKNYPRIDGSTSTLPLVQQIYKAMFTSQDNSWINLPQSASKTVPSYEKLIKNEADMILVPYASQDVLERAENAGVELEFSPISLEALIFITSIDNSTQNITEEQVRKIYIDYGINNWRELGGPDKELVPMCRNADSGSQSQLDNLVLKGESMHRKIKNNYVELTMDGLLEQVAFYHNVNKKDCFGLGYTLYYYLQNISEVTGIDNRLKVLDYEGISATPETIADGSYPLSSSYYAVIRKDLPKEHSARALIKWLYSEAANDCISRSGLTPIKH